MPQTTSPFTNPYIPANISQLVAKTKSAILVPDETAIQLIQRILIMDTFQKLIVMAADNLHAKDQANLSDPQPTKDPNRVA
jgi:hypothetical protein